MLTPSIEINDFMYIDKTEEWMEPIKTYLKNRTLPVDRRQVENVKK